MGKQTAATIRVSRSTAAIMIRAAALTLLITTCLPADSFHAKDPGPRPNPASTIPKPISGLNANELALFNESLLRFSEGKTLLGCVL